MEVQRDSDLFKAFYKNYWEQDVEDGELMIRIKESTSDTKILLFDDINTTGSPLKEMIRKLYKYNSNLNFDIYTVIGKDANN